MLQLIYPGLPAYGVALQNGILVVIISPGDCPVRKGHKSWSNQIVKMSNYTARINIFRTLMSLGVGEGIRDCIAAFRHKRFLDSR